ncbi:MAG TPA: hypothetical protein VKT73_07380 [Xanthobacteraceae bacterium]|nr:hypothetical protein [Xanthobacteraceae bacterium]
MGKAIDAAIRTAVYGVIAAAAGITAFLFLVIAAFLWTQQHYDTITACAVGGGVFLFVACLAAIMLAYSRRRAAKVEEEETAIGFGARLTDPAFLLMAAQLLRAVGIARLWPLAIAAIVAFGVADLSGPKRGGSKPRRHTQEPQRPRAAA